MNESFRARSPVWRTCRVLANRARLRMVALVGRRPVTVSVLARSVNVTVGVGSLYVRALESEGLLRTRRRGAWVECWPGHTSAGGTGQGLLNALNTRLQGDKKAVDKVFRLATAFTHPRRVEIYDTLQGRPQTLAELKAKLGIPGRALLRHLQKLQSRGFVRALGARARRYAITQHPDSFARALAHFVCRFTESGGACEVRPTAR